MSNSPQNSSRLPDKTAGVAVKFALSGIGSNLALSSIVTLSLITGMVLVLVLAIVFIIGSETPVTGLAISIAITLVFNLVSFLISPWIMDLTQKWLYQTRWVSLAEIEGLSPETAQIIRRVSEEKKLNKLRLGIIEDQNPTAFTYGNFPSSARVVVSQGLFKYLDGEETAAVYAHELGHIVHWDFAVMTLASTLVQICYLIYVFSRRMDRGGDNNQGKDALQTAAIAAYIFYLIGSYLLLYLSRTREYFADHFSAVTTGNPHALSRALVKIAYGIVEEGQRAKEPSRLLEGTRAMGIYDYKAATSTGTAYRVASSEKIGQVFLWDMFNPWGWWMELNSTHPLTGKRVRALSTYAEQLGLTMEFDMGRIMGEGKHLDKKRLYSHFLLDILLYSAEIIGLLAGLIMGLLLSTNMNQGVILALPCMGLGVGIFLKTLIMYPNFTDAPETDILALMSDPYASPLRGKPAKLEGELIGRGNSGYVFGSDFKLQDKTGLIFLRYSSRFGPIGNFLFGMSRVQNLIGGEVNTIGWFRRSIAPWMDLIKLETVSGTIVNSYHRFWSFILSGFLIVCSLFLLRL